MIGNDNIIMVLSYIIITTMMCKFLGVLIIVIKVTRLRQRSKC